MIFDNIDYKIIFYNKKLKEHNFVESHIALKILPLILFIPTKLCSRTDISIFLFLLMEIGCYILDIRKKLHHISVAAREIKTPYLCHVHNSRRN